MEARGWSEESILETIRNPAATAMTKDRRHLPTGTGEQRDDPAIVSITADGAYLVVNVMTSEIIALSDRFDANWVTPEWQKL
jgi:Colicin E5 ribonuclease domain